MKNFLKKLIEAILVVMMGAVLIIAIILSEYNSCTNTPILDFVIGCIEAANK